MNEEDAFLKAISENPDDDALRLVYADWLEEQGDERARYLREEVAMTWVNGRSHPTLWQWRLGRLRRWREGLGQDWLEVIDRAPLIGRDVHLTEAEQLERTRRRIEVLQEGPVFWRVETEEPTG